jgi:hypothetical protein
MRISRIVSGVAGAAVLVLVWQSPSYADNPKDGDKCSVTAGSNKGQTGTYTSGATYGEGSWGATECAQPDGTSKCASAKVVTVFNPSQIVMWRGYMEATQAGAEPQALEAWKTKYHAQIIKGSGGQVKIKVQGRTVTLDSSPEGLAKRLKKD